MNALMNIQIRIMSAKANADLREMRAEIAMLEKQMASANRAAAGFGVGGFRAMEKWGSQIQWAGRQLQYNFTIPILLAAGAATKFALDNERAMTRLKKVYGDGQRGAAFYRKEIEALDRAFEGLSNEFGVNRAEVINVAADWAAAGASGVALAKSVRLTLQTMILGEIEAKKATEALIAIQAQYGESIDDLARTIDIMNMVENQTGVSMAGLIEGFQRAAGVARSAGIDVRHLAAMISSLVPASGTAAQAGNALKTIISRLLSPTKEAAEVMGLMGINTKDFAWQSLNGTQRIEKMAESFKGLSTAQRAVVSSVIASRWQINKFDVLMRDIVNTQGYYQKSLKATADAHANFIQRERELNAVLESSPQKFKQIQTIMQNVLADAIQPMLPTLIRLANAFAGLMTSFQGLDPAVQKLIITFLLLVAAVGPIMKIFGSLMLLLGYVGSTFAAVGGLVFKFLGAILALAAAPFVWIGKGIGFIATGLMAVPGAVMKATAMLFGMVPGLAGFATSITALFARVPAMIGVAMAAGFAKALPILNAGLTGLSFAIAGFFSGIMRGMTLFHAASLALWAGWNAALLAIQKTYGMLMIASSKVVYGSMIALQLAFGQMFGHLWTKLAVLINLAWFTLQTQLRATWAATVLFLTSPMKILAGFKAMFAALAVLMSGGFTRLVAIARIGATAVAVALTGPWGLAIAAAIALFIGFRDQLGQIWNRITGAFSKNAHNLTEAFAPVVDFFQRAVEWIAKIFWKLPEGVRNAMIAVVRLVQQAAENVRNFFSGIFSGAGAPAVPNVQKHATGGFVTGPGTGTSDSILAAISNGEYVVNAKSTAKHRGTLEAINADRYATGGMVGAAQRSGSGIEQDLAAYQKIAAALNGIQWNEEMALVAEGFKSALPLFKRLLADYQQLNALAIQQAAAVDKQQRVVDLWKQKLDQANAAVDAQQNKLDDLQENLSKLTSAYEAHEDAMQAFASAPIEGMQAMSDAIFDNQLAQKKLQLQMLQWEQQHGSIDRIKNSMALLQGEIEKLQGTISGLRAAGAGSDITGPLEQQLQAMRDSYASMGNEVNNSPINQMQQQLDELQSAGQILDLENSIQFDPMIRQIDQLANGMNELPFDEIIAGIQREKDAMAALQPQIDAATAAVEAQKAAVDESIAARDAIQARYDLETEKLGVLKDAYDQTRNTINQVEEAMRGLSTAAQDNIAALEAAARAKDSYMSPGAQNFLDSAGANFPEVGDINNKIGREGGLADQSAMIDEWMKENSKQLSFDGIDMFAPIKDMWNKAWKWVEDNISPWVSKIWNAVTQTVSDIFGSDGDGGMWSGIGDGFKSVWETLVGWWNGFVDVIKSMWKLFGDDVMQIFGSIGDFFVRIWNDIGPKVKDLFGSLWELAQALWPVIKTVAAIIGGALLGAIKIVSSVLANTLGPVLNFIIDLFGAVIDVARGIVDFFVGIFTGDIGKAFGGILTIIKGTWDAIFAVFNGVVQTIWGVVKGLVDGIVGFFTWLWDVLVGHSIIPDMILAIVDWFVNAGKWVIEQVVALVDGVVQWFGELPGKVWTALVTLKDKLAETATTAFTFLWESARAGWALVIGWVTGLPQATWEKMILLKDKLADVATKAFSWFWETQKRGWSNIIGWITGLPQAAWDKFILLKDKLGNVASTAFQWFWDKAKGLWNGAGGIIGWIGSLPQASWDKFIELKDKLVDVATKAMTGMWDKMKSIFSGPNGILSWFGGLPGKIADKLGGIGSAIGEAVKNGWNAAAKWINEHAIAPVNSITSKFGLNIPYLPRFERGGVIPGAVSEKDNIIIAARTGEGILVPEAVQALGGSRGLDALNEIARRGGGMKKFLAYTGMEGFADGGVIGQVTEWLKKGAGFAMSKVLDPVAGFIEKFIPRPELLSKFLSGTARRWADAAERWGDGKDRLTVMPVGNAPVTAGYGQYPSGGVHRGVDFGVPTGTQVNAFRSGVVKTSGWDTTGFGNFVELQHPNNIVSRYGHNSELMRRVGDYVGVGWGISRSGNSGNSTGPHLHFEIKKNGTAVDPWPYLNGELFDNGGWLQHGMTMARNKTGSPEPVFTSEQWNILSRLVTMSTAVLKSITDPTAGAVPGLYGGAALALQGRLRAFEATSSTSANFGGTTTININGDLVLPNIKSGDDAEAFIKHLETLAG